jgi:hypothetical protein
VATRSNPDGGTPLFSLHDLFLYVPQLAIAAPAALKREARIVAAEMRAACVQPE